MRHSHYKVVSSFQAAAAASLIVACGSNASLQSDGGDEDSDSGRGGRNHVASGGGAAGAYAAASSTGLEGTGANSVGSGAVSGTRSGGGAAAAEGEDGGAHTSDGAPGLGGRTNDGTAAGGNTGDGKGGGDTGDGKGGGDTGDGKGGGSTGDGARGGDTGDGARGGGTGDGCIPTCFPSVLDNVNVIALGDATADGADVEGRMYVAHDAYFPSYAIGTRMPPDPARADLVVGNDLYFGGGSVANGKVSYAGVLELGVATALGGYHNEAVLDFAAVEQEMTADSAKLAGLAPNGTVTTGLEVFMTGTDPALNVFEVQAADLSIMTSLTISAPASSTALVNIRGESVALHDFGFTLVDIAREHILYNLPDATSLMLSGVGIQGSLLAPYVDLAFANGHIDGQLVVKNFSGSGESHPKYFMGCLPLCTR